MKRVATNGQKQHRNHALHGLHQIWAPVTFSLKLTTPVKEKLFTTVDEIEPESKNELMATPKIAGISALHQKKITLKGTKWITVLLKRPCMNVYIYEIIV